MAQDHVQRWVQSFSIIGDDLSGTATSVLAAFLLPLTLASYRQSIFIKWASILELSYFEYTFKKVIGPVSFLSIFRLKQIKETQYKCKYCKLLQNNKYSIILKVPLTEWTCQTRIHIIQSSALQQGWSTNFK